MSETGEYTFQQIDDIMKDHNKVKSLLEQNDVFKEELKAQLKRIRRLESQVIELNAIVNELNNLRQE